MLSSVESGFHCHSVKSQKKRDQMSVYAAYFTFLLCASMVLRKFSDGDFSAVLTLSAGIQCLGFFLLKLKVQQTRSVAGISSKTLETYILVFLFRLSSTLVKNGYLPIDRSGDWVYQTADIASLMIVLNLLYAVHKTYKSTYLEEHDTMGIWRIVPICVLLAVFLHGDLNNSPFYDIMWTIAMNLDTIAMVPQLWMLTKAGGEVDCMTGHFVAAIAASRTLSFAFWFYGFAELAPKHGGVNLSGWLIITAHALQLLISADFLYYYVRASVTGSRMVLPGIEV